MLLIDVIELSKYRCHQRLKANLKYATDKNFVGRSINGYSPGLTQAALMTPQAAIRLCEVQNFLTQDYQYGLLIYDAYRPKRAVVDFLTWSRQPPANDYELARKQKHYPHIQKPQLFELGYLAEDSNHCYGHTVDLVLIDINTGNKLPMGARYDFMDVLSHPAATSNEIGEAAFTHRKILTNAMQKFGFQPFATEYWHFSYQDKEVLQPMDIPITPEIVNEAKARSNLLGAREYTE